MKAKSQTTKTYTFINRDVAVDCVKQDLADPKVESVHFLDRTWIKQGEEDKFEVRTVYRVEKT